MKHYILAFAVGVIGISGMQDAIAGSGGNSSTTTTGTATVQMGVEAAASGTVAQTWNSIRLSWTAPGDDDTVGTACEYDLRYAPWEITQDTWPDAIGVVGVMLPRIAGSIDSCTVSDLRPGLTYWFAIKAKDEAGNWSAMSNVVPRTTALFEVQPIFATCKDFDADGAIDVAFLDKRGTGTLSFDYGSNGLGGIDVSYGWYGTGAGLSMCPANYDGVGGVDYAQLDRGYQHGTLMLNFASNGFASGFEQFLDWYGTSGLIAPCPADYNGDGYDDYAQLDRSTQGGLLQINNGPNLQNGFETMLPWYGGENFLPCAADYDGDQKADFTTLELANTGHLRVNFAFNGLATGYDLDLPWYGTNSLIFPCPGDYNGDGYGDYVQLDRSIQGGLLQINNGPDLRNGFETTLPNYGMGPNVIPCPADFDRDSALDFTTFDQARRTLAINYSANGIAGGYDTFIVYGDEFENALRKPAAQPEAETENSAEATPTVLEQNYPNPFNPVTRIACNVPVDGEVTLEVFNILGERVTTLVSGWHPAGPLTVTWDGGSFASGVYLYRISAGTYHETKKMILLK